METVILSTADVIERANTHDVLVVSKLEVILNDVVLVSVGNGIEHTRSET